MRVLSPIRVVLTFIGAFFGAAVSPDGWWERAGVWIEAGEYHAAIHSDHLQLINRAQGLRLSFHDEHVVVAPRELSDAPWFLVLDGSAPRRVADRPTAVAVATEDGETIFLNRPAGVRLAFAGATSRTLAPLDPAGGLVARVSADGRSAGFLAAGRLVVQLRATGTGHRLVLTSGELRVVTDPGGGPWGNAPLALTLTGGGGTSGMGALADTPDWIAEGNRLSVAFGAAVAAAGDVNADGYSDVIVGAPDFDAGAISEGRVFVFLGSDTGLRDRPIWTMDGNRENARFGSAVGTAGDVDGDGLDDVIVGAPFHSNAFEAEGRAYLFLGQGLAQKETPDWFFDGKQPFANLGGAVSGAGDVNDDGYDDVIVGAAFFDSPLQQEGAAFAFLGYPGGLRFRPHWIVDGGQDSAELGGSVAGAGDVNGDGFADVVVGAPKFSRDEEARSREGRVALYLGSAVGLKADPSWTALGSGPREEFGASVAAAGDVNGDGFADVIIGAPQAGDNGAAPGRASVYAGSARGLTATALWTAEGQPASRHGATVSTAGDVNGDGYADVLVGAPFATAEQTREGQVLLFLGGAAGPSAAADWSDVGGQSDAGFGRALAAAGDVDGDGFGDVLIGAPGFDGDQGGEGRALAYLGKGLPPSTTPDWTVSGGRALGWSVGGAGDVNGDGYSDVIAGDPAEDDARIWLGAPAGLPPVATRRVDGPTGSDFGVAVATAGDVDGDGYAEIVVGANELGANREGAVYVYPGAADFELDDTPPWSDVGQTAGAALGFSVATAGDVNGDGFADIVAGAPGSPGGGALYVWLGSASGPGPARVLSLDRDPAPDTDENFGQSVATAGDVNGDGFDDVIVGAPGLDGGLGQAFVYLGSRSGLSGAPAWSAVGEATQAGFGQSVASAGDVNGDGYADIAVGAGRGAAGTTGGRAYFFPGSASGPARSASWQRSEASAARFAFVVAAAGDVDGDGFGDVLISDEGRSGSPGGVWVYRGGPAGPADEALWSVAASGLLFGRSAGGAGDVNGDGVSDVVVGQPIAGPLRAYYGNAAGLSRVARQLRLEAAVPIALHGASDSSTGFVVGAVGRSAAGRTRLRMEVELDSSGRGYDDPLRRGTDRRRTDRPRRDRPSTIRFVETIDGLDAGTFYHWRVRFVSDDPLFPLTPWRSIPSNAATETKLRTAGKLPAPELSLIGPAPNEPVFPDSPPLIFSWARGPHTRFRLEWSSNIEFESRVEIVSVPDATDASGVGVLLPPVASWRSILRLGRNADVRSVPIFWRVTPLDGPASDAPPAPATIRMQPPLDPTLVAPANGAEFTQAQLPPLAWESNHNERFRVVFATAPELFEPTIVTDETLDSSLSDWETTWQEVIELSRRSDGRIYWAVFARDAIDRDTRSDVRRLRILLD